MAPRKNISSVEMMRGIAALMVAYFHMSHGTPGFLPETNVFFKLGSFGWAGVEIFFVISGFIIMHAMFYGGYTIQRIHKFVAKRLIRLEPPYIISIIVVLALAYISTLSPYYRGQPFHPNWKNVIAHLGYVNAFTGWPWLQAVYWSLAVEFEFYLGLALLYPLLMHTNTIVSYVSIVALMAMSFLPTGLAHIFHYLPFFCMGILLTMYQVGQLQKTPFLVFFIATCVLCLYNSGYILAGLGLATVLIIAFVKNAPKPLVWLGHISFSLYLLHIPFGGRIINLSEVLLKNTALRPVVVFVALGVSIGVAAIFNKVVEKPFQKISKKMTY